MDAETFMGLYWIGFLLIIPVWFAVAMWRESRRQRRIDEATRNPFI